MNDLYEKLRNGSYEKDINERLPKVLALQKKYGTYILDLYPEALERFEELMLDEVPEPYRTLEKENSKREL